MLTPRLFLAALPVAALAAAWLFAGGILGSSDGGEGQMACLESQDATDCGQRLEDNKQRGLPPRLGNDPALDQAAGQISKAVNRPACVTAPNTEKCVGVNVPHTPTQEDVDDSRSALIKLGYDNAIIRLALPNDAAPQGAVLAEVRVGNGCVLSYSTRQFSGARVWTAGLRSTGACLDE